MHENEKKFEKWREMESAENSYIKYKGTQKSRPRNKSLKEETWQYAHFMKRKRTKKAKTLRE